MNQTISLQTIDRIRGSARQIVRELGFMHSHLAGTPLSPSAVHCIIELGLGHADNARALSEQLKLEKSTVSRMLKKLEADGLLLTDRPRADKRMRRLHLSAQGEALLVEIEDYARTQLQTALAKLNAGELNTLETGLSLFAQALQGTALEAATEAEAVSIRPGFQSCAVADITRLHAAFYSTHYQFGPVFECKVATELSAFVSRLESTQNTMLNAYLDDRLLGSVSIDGEDLGEDTAHLRWFIVSPEAQGLGLGKRLLQSATAFVDKQGFARTRLWTFKGLDAARHLYEAEGFRLVNERAGAQWGTRVMEQEFVRD